MVMAVALDASYSRVTMLAMSAAGGYGPFPECERLTTILMSRARDHGDSPCDHIKPHCPELVW